MASDRVTTYSADTQAISFAGQSITGGFADGEFCTCEMAAEDFTAKVGSDGEVARARTNNRMSKITIKLLQTSLGNNILTQIRALGLSSPNGADVGVFSLTDNGIPVVHVEKAWIAKAPKVSRGREVDEYEWELAAASTDLTPNGSPSI